MKLALQDYCAGRQGCGENLHSSGDLKVLRIAKKNLLFWHSNVNIFVRHVFQRLVNNSYTGEHIPTLIKEEHYPRYSLYFFIHWALILFSLGPSYRMGRVYKWLPCSGHTISSTRPSVSPFRDFVCYQLNLHWESPKNYIQLAQHCVTSSWSCFLGHSHYRTAMVGTWWYWVSIRRYQTWMKVVKQITQHDQSFIANITLRRGGI